MRALFRFITRMFGFFVKTIWISFMFLIVYGIIREQIDKLIEKSRTRKKKIKIISELLKTKEGKERLAKSMTETDKSMAEKNNEK